MDVSLEVYLKLQSLSVRLHQPLPILPQCKSWAAAGAGCEDSLSPALLAAFHCLRDGVLSLWDLWEMELMEMDLMEMISMDPRL